MKLDIYFPKRLFRWFIFRQLLLSGLFLTLLDLVLYLVFQRQGNFSEEMLGQVRAVLLWSLPAAFIVMACVSVAVAYELMTPLGRLIEKTRRLSSAPTDEDSYTEEDLNFDDVGEWYDLERALTRLGKDLRQKTIRLSREKTELRTIMSGITEAVIAVDLTKHALFYNTQFALNFGVESGQEMLGLSQMVRSPEVLAAVDRSLKEGVQVRVETVLNLAGRSHTFLVSVAPLRKKHNQEIYGATAVFHDITEMKRAENIRIEFVGNVSHELRTPLTSIKGYLQTIRQDFSKNRLEMIPQFLEIVSKNVDRLIMLVSDLLDLSSLESGGELLKSVVNTRDLTEMVLSQLNVRDHVVHVQYGAKEFEADAPRVEQVLRNLVQNAVRYVPKGKNIDIEWRMADTNVILKVKDDGPGIPKEHHDRLFERFYRVDEARSRELGGTGIGLSLVKHIMHRHGGSVRMISEPGQGAEFVCEFPSRPTPG